MNSLQTQVKMAFRGHCCNVHMRITFRYIESDLGSWARAVGSMVNNNGKIKAMVFNL